LDFSGDVELEFLHGAMPHREMAAVVDMEIQSPSGNVYSHITGGYVRLRGKLGEVRLDQLPNAGWRGDRGGHFAYEFSLDTTEGPCHEDMESYPDQGPVLCVPVATYDRANPEDLRSIQVYCILLDRVDEETPKFTRVGWMSVLDDWEEEVHQELRWITDYACTELRVTEGLDIVTIV
jgi:hypothetical protein